MYFCYIFTWDLNIQEGWEGERGERALCARWSFEDSFPPVAPSFPRVLDSSAISSAFVLKIKEERRIAGGGLCGKSYRGRAWKC